MRTNKSIFWLKLSFMAGAITDALALVPMLCPPAAKIMWGFDDFTGSYYFAMGYGASLMLAWTILLIWAFRNPLPRRFVALLTVIVVLGFIVAEAITAICGYVDMLQLAPTLVLQVILLALFSYAYYGSRKYKEAK